MEGQGVAASAASEAGRHGESGAGAVVATDFDDPGVSHVTGDTSGGGEGQWRNGDDTIVMPALGRPEDPDPGPQSHPEEHQSRNSQTIASQPSPADQANQPTKADKPDNMGDPDLTDDAGDDHTIRNQTPPDVTAPAGQPEDFSAAQAPASDAAPAASSSAPAPAASSPTPAAASSQAPEPASSKVAASSQAPP